MIERADGGVQPEDGDPFEQIQHDIESNEAGRGPAEMIVGQGGEVSPEQRCHQGPEDNPHHTGQ